MDEEIKKLFITRDTAVEKQNRKLFLSTQVSELDYGSVDGYMGIKHMKSQVLCIHKEVAIETIVWVKETYSPPEKDSYSSFPVYFLVNTQKGWKIYKVR